MKSFSPYAGSAQEAALYFEPGYPGVAFKGYMSTSGSSYVPLIVADQVSVPPELAPFYSEKQVAAPFYFDKEVTESFYSEKEVYLSPVFAASTHATNHPEAAGLPEDVFVFACFNSAAGLPEDAFVFACFNSAAGHSEDAFVFACFNSAYKIAPTIFLAWISILKQVPKSVLWVPKSVLWILDPPAEARANLRREAKAQGVSPTRLVFTDKVEMGRYLLVKANADLFLDTPNTKHQCQKLTMLVEMGRYLLVKANADLSLDTPNTIHQCQTLTILVDMGKHLLVKANADLFLDTPIYNAHSTAADAFWAGLPMVTLPREKMAGRVCASLALSLSLQLQIARSLSEYISLAVTLARRKHTLRRLRKLLAKRRTDPLHGRMFDVAGWMEAYEKGLKMAVEVQRP
ncbi:glycosyl transferase family 41-domain-containing protein [Baffinella frigidus]|nr:glycosyl transferase family 41-domain-containing protein [Cryptophyta sp. CCMP2293]